MPYTKAERTKMAAYAAKTSMSDAARKFGVSASAVRLAMREAGVTPNRRGAPSAYTLGQKGRAIALVEMGASTAKIQRETGISAKYARSLWRQQKTKPAPKK